MTLKYRKDYQKPHYTLPDTKLDFTLDAERTIVKSSLTFRDYDASKSLLLNGQYMELTDIRMDGKKLTEKEYVLTDTTLTLKPLKKDFVLETEVIINPAANTRLMGLYASDGILCTQCEPEGFRSITYYPDHSDVPSHWTVTIHADRKKYPVLLSNGNKIKDMGNTVVFEDPFAKPSYLFALVAGDLDSIHDTFTTMSGKVVKLGLYCEPGKKDRMQWAMASLKKAMKWDEDRFGLEYDLDSFNIVAVSHFNAGAMENKSLNIFNDAALLASPDTATDATYEYIEHVIAHEYFHNYSGDRVTLRSWFELSLKEGFTVFRDQEFGYDVRSRSVGRIDDAITLRSFQFPEDDGPLAHPVRPDSYHEIENFYTLTIYEKGAEVIRMQQAIVGPDAFRKGCDIYFKRYDGQAVTIDEFVKSIEDASGVDMTQFKQWYSVAGRPKVSVETIWQDGTFIVRMKQSHKTCSSPFVIPLHYGLVAADGHDMEKGTFILNKSEQEWIFKELPERPSLSLNRFFTSPVDINITYNREDRLRLMTHDCDLFNRYDVAHQYALEVMTDMVRQRRFTPDMDVIRALGSYFEQPNLDKAFLARAIVLPTEDDLVDRLDVVDIDAVKEVRRVMRQAFADTYRKELLQIYWDNQDVSPYSPEAEPAAKRALKNVSLGYLALTDDRSVVSKQYDSSNNLTDRLGALSVLVNNAMPEAERALADFYHRYEGDDLVINKWLAIQARNPSGDALSVVKGLINHSAFDYKNPNKARAVLGAFSGNLGAFNRADGEGYRFFAGQCALIDRINPHLSARLLTAFSKYKKFDENRQKIVRNVLQELQAMPSLSSLARETVERMI